MLLSARILNNCTSVNSWDWAEEAQFTQGDTADIYFMLVDATRDKAVNHFEPAGRRYVPAAGATMSCIVENINDAVRIVRAAVQPFAQDPSIWKLSILGTDTILGTCALALTLNESGKLTRGRIEAAVLINDMDTL